MVHGIHSRLLLLPSELKHRIAELSSHDSLASLARIHTAYQSEAEQALYHTLPRPSLKCLETLATNSEKAGFVRFLTIECDHYRRAMDYLLNALVNMHSLSDFRVLIHRYEVQPWLESLNKILWSVYELGSFDLLKTNCWRHSNGHFRLQSLYCQEALDLSRIIRSQTELQILGIYGSYFDEVKFLGILKRLRNAQLHLPVVVTLVTLECDWVPIFHNIIIFPAFYPVDRHPTIHQVLTEYFDKDQSSDMLANISKLSIYLVDSCDMPRIHELAKNLSMRLPNIISLNFCFENPCEIPSQEVKKIISLFPDLLDLSFDLWASRHNGDGKIPEDIKRAHVKDWELACPGLISVSFIDGLRIGDPWKVKGSGVPSSDSDISGLGVRPGFL